MLFNSDHMGSDDIDAFLEMSRQEVQVVPSRQVDDLMTSGEPSYLAKSRLQGRVGALNLEIKSIDESIADLQNVRAGLVSELSGVQAELNGLSAGSYATPKASGSGGKGKQVSRGGSSIDYTQEFDWTSPLRGRMKQIFGIQSFRLCQEGVCNASMDGRDVVCVMPTGGGKSLTYQLPAVMSPGCTLVISPLLSLITDQILHLREAGIDAVMLTGATSKTESRDIFARLTASTRNGASSSNEIKLVYVTPEKIAKSKQFMGLLEKLVTAGKLARIVIDEAHCVSQLGHDFRPDYKKLSVLKQLFPSVPILALSATCPPKVLADLLKVLRLKPVVDGNAADKIGTVYFSAPLYRKNLHYTVVPKPSSGPAVIKAMSEYIREHHPGDSGIVYCLSKKDTETVAQGLIDVSEGKIRAGVYHADVNDAQKERLHVKWRSGEIQVVCATIAFGLGIDKPNVRFVLHHSMSKSLDGFYQESGRAGRDGNDSDCVLYYRGQDASRLSGLICGEIEGQDKLHEMLKFAQDMLECRKILFANYFSTSSSLSLSAWSDSEGNTLTRCGHCDNCTRSKSSITTRDVTLESWQVLKVLEHVSRDGGRITVGMLADLVRGAGGGAYSASTGGKKGKGKEKISLDLDEVAGGKVTMNKNDVEALIIELILSKYLREDFHQTAYAVNVYVIPGPYALRLTRLPRIKIEAGEGSRLSHTFPIAVKAKRKSAGAGSKRKFKAVNDDDDDESGEEISGVDAAADSEDEWDDPPPPTAVAAKPKKQAKPRKSDTARTASLPSSRSTGAASSSSRTQSSIGAKKPSRSTTLTFSDDDDEGEPIHPSRISALAAAAAQKRAKTTTSTFTSTASGSKSASSAKAKSKVRVPDSDAEDEDAYDADIVNDSEDEELGLDPDGWAFSMNTKRTASASLGLGSYGNGNGKMNGSGATGSSDTDLPRSSKKPRTSMPSSSLAWTGPSWGAVSPAGVEVMELSSD